MEVDGGDAAVSGVVLDFVRPVEVSDVWRIFVLLTVRPDGRHKLILNAVIRLLSR